MVTNCERAYETGTDQICQQPNPGRSAQPLGVSRRREISLESRFAGAVQPGRRNEKYKHALDSVWRA